MEFTILTALLEYLDHLQNFHVKKILHAKCSKNKTNCHNLLLPELGNLLCLVNLSNLYACQISHYTYI